MASSFGWDWGPDFRTAALWKPVRIERWATARLAQVRPVVGVAPDGTGTVQVHVEIERSGLEPDTALELTAEVSGVRTTTTIAAGENGAVLSLRVPEAPLWWPVGHGDQPLAELSVELKNDQIVDAWTRRIGFRTVEIDTGDDEYGTRFSILINGKPIAVRGANWIPDDHFVSRITRERLDRRLDQALGAHLNLVRIWGGGMFESDDFYELCDEKGLLVWQDFLLACAAYPEEEPLRTEIEAEARENVVRLMPHPSLILWNGGNENLWGHEDWDWKRRLGDLTWGQDYAQRLFRQIVAELDPTRPYSDNSPYTPRRTPEQSHPNDADRGTHHQWEVWNRIDWTAYRSEIPRFCSEFGYQAPPAWRTLTDHVRATDGTALAEAAAPYADPVFLIHQKADDGTGKLERGMDPHTGVPQRFEDWHWAAQLNQARAIRHAVEHYRSYWPRTAGWIVWQLNDCWPVVSWALVDYEERPKPVYFALRRAAAPRALYLTEGTLVAVNDTDEPWLGTSEVRRETFAGEQHTSGNFTVSAQPRSVVVLPLPADLTTAKDPAGEVLVAELDGLRAVKTFGEDVTLTLDPDPLEVSADKVDGGYRIDVRARSFASDITVHPDRLASDAQVDDGVISLPAGARASFLVTSTADLDPAGLTRAPVLRTANDLKAVAVRTASPATGSGGHMVAD
nr:glycoside hydrolase family 2 TIM barrel-domain containing protein [Kineosporia babensis]